MVSSIKIIVGITVILSLLSFRNVKILNALVLWPAMMKTPKTYYRFLTAGFVHVDYGHLFVNMFSFFFFGIALERHFSIESQFVVLLYLTGIIVACIPGFLKNRKNIRYQTLGASGGVASIVFASIYLSPWRNIIEIGSFGLPSIAFAFIYIIYTAYLSKKSKGIINHDAHLWGAIYGFLFMFMTDPSHGAALMQKLRHPVW